MGIDIERGNERGLRLYVGSNLTSSPRDRVVIKVFHAVAAVNIQRGGVAVVVKGQEPILESRVNKNRTP